MYPSNQISQHSLQQSLQHSLQNPLQHPLHHPLHHPLQQQPIQHPFYQSWNYAGTQFADRNLPIGFIRTSGRLPYVKSLNPCEYENSQDHIETNVQTYKNPDQRSYNSVSQNNFRPILPLASKVQEASSSEYMQTTRTKGFRIIEGSKQVTEITNLPSTRNTRTLRNLGCNFCRTNGEQQSYYKCHSLRDIDGVLTCPVLRAYKCEICQATGDKAHTVTYCPLSKKISNGQKPDSIVRRLNSTKVNCCGKIRN